MPMSPRRRRVLGVSLVVMAAIAVAMFWTPLAEAAHADQGVATYAEGGWLEEQAAADMTPGSTWRIARASAYGSPSPWDPTNYYGRRTSWHWHCSIPTHREWSTMTRESMGIANRDRAMLGTWIEIQIRRPDGSWSDPLQIPVIDGGPWAEIGTDWIFDIMEPVVQREGWWRAGSRLDGTRDGPVYGLREVLWRPLPWGRFCPRDGDFAGSLTPPRPPPIEWWPRFGIDR